MSDDLIYGRPFGEARMPPSFHGTAPHTIPSSTLLAGCVIYTGSTGYTNRTQVLPAPPALLAAPAPRTFWALVRLAAVPGLRVGSLRSDIGQKSKFEI